MNPVRKKVAVTVDDGPSANTEKLVTYLQGRGIDAVMFFIGQNMEKHPAAVDFAIQSGVTIGNHSYSHPHFPEITLEQAKDEIMSCDALIDDAYARNGRPRTRKHFRFPYLETGGTNEAALQEFLHENGFSCLEAPFMRDSGYHLLNGKQRYDVSASFACWDWELWYNSANFGFPELIRKLEAEPGPSSGSLKYGGGNEVFVLHDDSWASASGKRHFEVIFETLDGFNLEIVPAR